MNSAGLSNRRREKRNQSNKGVHTHPMPTLSLSLFVRIMLPTVVVVACATSSPGVASAQEAAPRPCDVYASTTPCVAAISTTRSLYKAYTGPLYQVTRKSDKTNTDIGLLPGGYANAAKQDSFSTTSRRITTTLPLRLPGEQRAVLARTATIFRRLPTLFLRPCLDTRFTA